LPAAVRKTGAWLFVMTLALYGATSGGSMATDIMSYEVTKGIVESGTVAMSGNIFNMEAHRGIDGRYYAPYGIGHAIYSIPFYLAGRAVESWGGVRIARNEALRKAGFVIGSAVAAALTVWITFFFAWRLTSSADAAVRTALTLGFGTILWPYAKFGFSAPLAALCVTLGTYGVWVGMRFTRPLMLLVGGIGFGCAVLVRHELILLCLPVAVWIAAESKWEWRETFGRGLIAAMPVVVAIVITLIYNYARFENPIDTGYLRDVTAERGSFPVGLTGLLISPGGSLFIYSPVLLAGCVALARLLRHDRRTAVLFASEVLVLVLFYASFAHWDADRSYGPRYLLPVIPLLVLPLAPWLTRQSPARTRHVLAAVVALSVLVQIPGVLVDFTKVGYTPEVGRLTWDQRTWTWRGAEITLNTKASLTAVPTNLTYLARGERPALKGPKGEARDFSEQFAFSLDFWWLYLFYLGAVSAPVSVALGLSGLAVALVAAWNVAGSW
jgi:hypothetical protein